MLYVSNILAFAIVGGVRLSSSDPFTQRLGEDFAQADLSIFIAVCIVYTIVFFFTLFAIHVIVSRERRILYGGRSDLLSPLAPIEYTGPIQFSQSILLLQGSLSAPTTPSSGSSVLPLTSDNLRKLHQETGIMADFTTPKKSSGISNGTTSSLAGEVGQVRETLCLNGLHMEDDDAAKTFQEYLNEARDLLTNPRHSATSKQLLQGIGKIRMDYAIAMRPRSPTNSLAYFKAKLDMSSRRRKGEDPENIDQEDLPVPIGWAARDWVDDGLDANYNRVFQAGSVPKLDSIDENLKAILEKLPEISKPQPDILYGTSIKKHYTHEERAVIAQHKGITQISLDLACPFFVGEIKTYGDFEEAANQANPGGAAMVEAHRKLKILAQLAAAKAKTNDTTNTVKSTTANPSKAKTASPSKAITASPSQTITASPPKNNPPKATTTSSGAKTTATPDVPTVNTKSKASNVKSREPKADFSTKAYSLVLQPKYAQIHVHWVEVGSSVREGEESLTYHMHCLESYALNKEDQMKACRAAINNILDWGLGERNTKIKALLNQVYSSSKAINAAKGKGKAMAADESPSSKKRRMDDVDNDDTVT
ncbi:MAG: hypothetical protein Q9171_003874 [Xanthocarpia ochracea]